MPSNLQQLKEEIQRLRPEIMELKFGCNVKCKLYSGFFLRKEKIHNGFVVGYSKLTNEIPVFFYGAGIVWCSNENLEILGRPITLEDVLAVLYLDDEDYRPDVNIGWKKNVGECFLFTFNEKMYAWEYGKPLDDQSEETISFLYKLIK